MSLGRRYTVVLNAALQPSRGYSVTEHINSSKLIFDGRLRALGSAVPHRRQVTQHRMQGVMVACIPGVRNPQMMLISCNIRVQSARLH